MCSLAKSNQQSHFQEIKHPAPSFSVFSLLTMLLLLTFQIPGTEGECQAHNIYSKVQQETISLHSNLLAIIFMQSLHLLSMRGR